MALEYDANRIILKWARDYKHFFAGYVRFTLDTKINMCGESGPVGWCGAMPRPGGFGVFTTPIPREGRTATWWTSSTVLDVDPIIVLSISRRLIGSTVFVMVAAALIALGCFRVFREDEEAFYQFCEDVDVNFRQQQQLARDCIEFRWAQRLEAKETKTFVAAHDAAAARNRQLRLRQRQ